MVRGGISCQSGRAGVALLPHARRCLFLCVGERTVARENLVAKGSEQSDGPCGSRVLHVQRHAVRDKRRCRNNSHFPLRASTDTQHPAAPCPPFAWCLAGYVRWEMFSRRRIRVRVKGRKSGMADGDERDRSHSWTPRLAWGVWQDRNCYREEGACACCRAWLEGQ